MESGFVEVRGVRLHYLRWGAGGRPLVLVHGNSHCAGVWAPIAPGLVEAGFQVTAVDLRGHGEPDKPTEGHDWASLRDDLAGLLPALDLRDAAEEHDRRRDAFRLWDEAVLRAYVEHGTAERADGTVELRGPRHVEAALYEAMFDAGPWQGLSRPDLPLLAVFGERSGRVGEGRDPAARMRPMFPRVETRVLPGATHFGPMEQPAAFAAIVREFADGLR